MFANEKVFPCLCGHVLNTFKITKDEKSQEFV